jgi:hypothetical protein
MTTSTDTISKADRFDDPIWEYTLGSKLTPYIPFIREWWQKYDSINVSHTGVYSMSDMLEHAPSGLMYRVTNTPVRSPIKGVQAFPFIPVVYLQLTGISGGVTRMVERVCMRGMTIEEFTVIEKHNLPSTYHQGQFVALVPTDVINSVEQLGRFVYLTVSEQVMLTMDMVPDSVKLKINKK